MSKNRHFDAYLPVRIAAPIQKIENSFRQQQSIPMRESDCGEPAYWPQWDQDFQDFGECKPGRLFREHFAFQSFMAHRWY